MMCSMCQIHYLRDMARPQYKFLNYENNHLLGFSCADNFLSVGIICSHTTTREVPENMLPERITGFRSSKVLRNIYTPPWARLLPQSTCRGGEVLALPPPQDLRTACEWKRKSRELCLAIAQATERVLKVPCGHSSLCRCRPGMHNLAFSCLSRKTGRKKK